MDGLAVWVAESGLSLVGSGELGVLSRDWHIPGGGQMGTAVGRRREEPRADVTSNRSCSAGETRGEIQLGSSSQEVKLYQE